MSAPIGYIEIESGVNAAGEGFCHVSIYTGLDGEMIGQGQLAPDEVREMARQWLEGAEAAEHDAAVYSFLVNECGSETGKAGQFLAALRHHRGDGLKAGEERTA